VYLIESQRSQPLFYVLLFLLLCAATTAFFMFCNGPGLHHRSAVRSAVGFQFLFLIQPRLNGIVEIGHFCVCEVAGDKNLNAVVFVAFLTISGMGLREPSFQYPGIRLPLVFAVSSVSQHTEIACSLSRGW